MRLSTLVLTALLGLAAGCVGELTPIGAADDDDDVGGPDAGDDVGSAAGRQFYNANIAPMMIKLRPKGTCVSCHQGTDAINGPDFLGETSADNYDTLVVNTRLVAATPATSVFCTKPDHNGNALCTGAGVPYAECTEDEVTKAGQWIMLEAGQN
jgi:hypothetical protein